jgi:hypothetical protein
MIVRKLENGTNGKECPPAAGQFGIAAGASFDVRSYRPAGCPSVEQFAARFCVTNDGDKPSRAA